MVDFWTSHIIKGMPLRVRPGAAGMQLGISAKWVERNQWGAEQVLQRLQDERLSLEIIEETQIKVLEDNMFCGKDASPARKF